MFDVQEEKDQGIPSIQINDIVSTANTSISVTKHILPAKIAPRANENAWAMIRFSRRNLDRLQYNQRLQEVQQFLLLPLYHMERQLQQWEVLFIRRQGVLQHHHVSLTNTRLTHY